MAEPFTGSTAQTVAYLSLSVKSPVRTGELSRKKHISCSLTGPRYDSNSRPSACCTLVQDDTDHLLEEYHIEAPSAPSFMLHQLSPTASPCLNGSQQHPNSLGLRGSPGYFFFPSWLGSLNVSEQLQCTHSYEHLFLSFIPLLWASEN